jgi:hypothetical protein
MCSRKKCSENDYMKIIRMLYGTRSSCVDPSVNDNQAIRNAIWKGNYAIVSLLLRDPRVDPNVIMRDAVAKGHYATLDQLLKHPRANPALLGLLEQCTNPYSNITNTDTEHEIMYRLLNDSRVIANQGDIKKAFTDLVMSKKYIALEHFLRHPRSSEFLDEEMIDYLKKHSNFLSSFNSVRIEYV